MSYRDRPPSERVTAEANRLNQWAAQASTTDLLAWDADLRGLQTELHQLRLELRAGQALSIGQQQARTRRLRELALRVGDMKAARWGD